MRIDTRPWQDCPVFVTGHTGFKGGWLSLWLHRLGARVHGYALDPPTVPAFFDVIRAQFAMSSDVRANLADISRLRSALGHARPEVIFHLAAQPLVRESYRDPLGTLATNVMGTANLLEAARGVNSIRAIVVVTTDKVYLNHEEKPPYREGDCLGGHDPYSASKAAAEIVVGGFRASYFDGPSGHPARVATARAGNVIGGGDWAAARLVPDCLRSFADGKSVSLRFPAAVRPWQHVLEPLAGYLRLAEHLLLPDGGEFAKAWNFGPDESSNATVGEVAQTVARLWGHGARVELASSLDHPHEAGLLRLDSSAANAAFGWRPRWSLEQALTRTIEWHRAWLAGDDMTVVSMRQIEDYMAEKIG